jgi:hypothetical protein
MFAISRTFGQLLAGSSLRLQATRWSMVDCVAVMAKHKI